MSEQPNPWKDMPVEELLERLNRRLRNLTDDYVAFEAVPGLGELEELKERHPSLTPLVEALLARAPEGFPDPEPDDGKPGPRKRVLTPQELMDELGSKEIYAKEIVKGLTEDEEKQQEMRRRSDSVEAHRAAEEDEPEEDEPEEEAREEEEPPEDPEEPGGEEPAQEAPEAPQPARPPVRKVVTLSELLQEVDPEDAYAKEILEGLADDEKKTVEMRIRSKVERLRAEMGLDAEFRISMEYLLDTLLEGERDLDEERRAAREEAYAERDARYAERDRLYEEKEERYREREEALEALAAKVRPLFDPKYHGQLTTVENTVRFLIKALKFSQKKLGEETRLEEERSAALEEYRRLLERREEIDSEYAETIVANKDLFFKNFSQFFTSVEDRVGWTNLYENNLKKFMEKKSAEIDEELAAYRGNEEIEETAKSFHGFYLAVGVLLQIANYYREICINARQEANAEGEVKDHLIRFVQSRLPDEKIEDIVTRARDELMPELLAQEKDIDDSELKSEKELRLYYQKAEKRRRQLLAVLKEFETRDPEVAGQKDEGAKLSAIYSRFTRVEEELAASRARMEELEARASDLAARRRSLTTTLVEEFATLRSLFSTSRQYIGMDQYMSATNVTKAIESIPAEFEGVRSVFSKLLAELDALQEQNRDFVAKKDEEMGRLMELVNQAPKAVVPEGVERELVLLRNEVEQLRGRNKELKQKVLRRIVPKIIGERARVPEAVSEMHHRVKKAKKVLSEYSEAYRLDMVPEEHEYDLEREATLPLLVEDYLSLLADLEAALKKGIVPREEKLDAKYALAARRLPRELRTKDVMTMHRRLEAFLREAERNINELAGERDARMHSFVEDNKAVLRKILETGRDTVKVDLRLARLDDPESHPDDAALCLLLDYTSLRTYVTSCYRGEEDKAGRRTHGTVDMNEAEAERHRLAGKYGYEDFDDFQKDMKTLTADLAVVKGGKGLEKREDKFLSRFRYKKLVTVLDKLESLHEEENPKLARKLYKKGEDHAVEADYKEGRSLEADFREVEKARAALFARAQKLNPEIQSEARDGDKALGLIERLVRNMQRNLASMSRLEEEKEKVLAERNLVPGVDTFEDFHRWLKERNQVVNEIETEADDKARICDVAGRMLEKKDIAYPNALSHLKSVVADQDFIAIRQHLEYLSDLRTVLRAEFKSGEELLDAIKREVKLCRPYLKDLSKLEKRKADFTAEVLELK